MGSRPPQPAHMRQGLSLGVVDHVNVTAVVPTDVNPKARVKPAKLGHADGISGGVVAPERELVAVHVAIRLRCVVDGVNYSGVSGNVKGSAKDFSRNQRANRPVKGDTSRLRRAVRLTGNVRPQKPLHRITAAGQLVSAVALAELPAPGGM